MKVKFFILITVILLVFPLIIQRIDANDSDSNFPINDTILEYHSNDYWRQEATGNIWGIEWGINFSTIEYVNITSLSNTVIIIEKNCSITINSAYQERNSSIYNPINFSLIFYDDNDNELGSDNSTSMSFSLTRYINKQTGKRVLAHNPFGASEVVVAAYYNNSEVYGRTRYTISLFGDVGSFTNVFDVNASSWEIGTIIDENFTVTGSGRFQNYNTWILNRNTIPEGIVEYVNRREYEKTSGLYIKTDYKRVKTDDYYQEYQCLLQDIGGAVFEPTTTTTTTSPTTTTTITITTSADITTTSTTTIMTTTTTTTSTSGWTVPLMVLSVIVLIIIRSRRKCTK